MALRQSELKALALEIAAALPPCPPQQVEIVLSTGEMLSTEAMALARCYDNCSPKQRALFDAMLAACGE